MQKELARRTQRHNTTATLIQTKCNSAGVRCGMFMTLSDSLRNTDNSFGTSRFGLV